MATPETTVLPRRVRRAYELGRLRQSLWDALPALPLGMAMVAVAPGLTNLLIALGMILAVVALRWLGRTASRGVGPALALAWIPLFLPIVSLRIGHFCTPTYCHSVCQIACSVGGIISGFLLARLLKRCDHRPVAWAVSAGVLLLASAAGCHCVGPASILAFAAGLGFSTITTWLRQALRRRV